MCRQGGWVGKLELLSAALVTAAALLRIMTSLPEHEGHRCLFFLLVCLAVVSAARRARSIQLLPFPPRPAGAHKLTPSDSRLQYSPFLS